MTTVLLTRIRSMKSTVVNFTPVPQSESCRTKNSKARDQVQEVVLVKLVTALSRGARRPRSWAPHKSADWMVTVVERPRVYCVLRAPTSAERRRRTGSIKCHASRTKIPKTGSSAAVCRHGGNFSVTRGPVETGGCAASDVHVGGIAARWNVAIAFLLRGSRRWVDDLTDLFIASRYNFNLHVDKISKF